MKYIFISCFLLIFQIQTFSQTDFVEKINNLFLDSLFESSGVSVNIYDLTDKKTLYEKNSKLLFRPASNLKILTSAAGLYFLGPDYQFGTYVYHSGKIADSICYGNLYVVGGGDPIFSVYDMDTLAMKIKAAGIKEIRGNIYGDVSIIDSLFWGKGWMWDDDPSSDAPYLSALNVNGNCVDVHIEPGNNGNSAKVNIFPESGFYKLLNKAITDSTDTSRIKITRDWINRKNEIYVTGAISVNGPPAFERINLYNPALFFLNLLKEKLSSQNIRFDGQLYFAAYDTNAVFLYSKNHSFREVISKLNKDSDNLSAEMTLRALSLFHFNKPATAEKGIILVDSLIKLTGLNPEKYRIVDGSGTSHYNLISTELIMEILKLMSYSKPELFNILYDSFPVAGVDGTLKRRMKDSPAFQNIHAKTGTLSGVSTLSGCVLSANGHFIAFSIFVNNYVGSSRNAVKFEDNICKFIAEYK